MTWNRSRSEGGYTLTELMVTLGTFGVLMGIAVPTIQSQIARQEVQGSSRRLVEVLRGARDAAVNEGVPRYVLLRPGRPGSYQVYKWSGTAWVPDENEVHFPGSIGLEDADVTAPAVGGAPVAGASVPENAIYFDTRGRYPFGYSGSYTITLRGRTSLTPVIRVYAQTGQVVEE